MQTSLAFNPRLSGGRSCGISSKAATFVCSLSSSGVASSPHTLGCIITVPFSKFYSMQKGNAMSDSSFGLSLLDREKFRIEVPCVALRVPCRDCNQVVKAISGFILRVPKVKPVVHDPEDPASMRLILLAPDVKAMRKSEVGSSERSSRSSLRLEGLDNSEAAALKSVLEKGNVTIVPHASYQKSYNMLTANEVFRQLIPLAKEWPASFETAGHVAHLNLREEMLPYKKLIGQVLLDKNRNLRTIVNKTSHIASEFRTFPMEVIAGDDDTMVEVREGGSRFRFDFREVYWNSRLQYEHARVVKSIKPGTIVCDMMAGIGPFAVPAAMQGCVVYANDLNPKSYEYLVENSRLNKGCEERLHASNQCGRDFVRRLISEKKRFDHVVMNLPATAIEFLDVFPGLLYGRPNSSIDSEDAWWDGDMPLVHCYCFTTSEHDRTNDVLGRVAQVLGLNDDISALGSDARVHDVRDVAPHKWMMCAEFRMPRSVMFGPPASKIEIVDSQPSKKKQRTK